MRKKFSIRKLAAEFGMDRATASKVLSGIDTLAEAKEALKEWGEQREQAKSANVDPETGLSWWQARQREAALRERQKRMSEADGGTVMLPVSVIELAGEMAAGKFRNLASNLYTYGLPQVRVGGDWDPVVERLGKEFVEDFLAYLSQWCERQKQLMVEKD